MNTTSHNIVSPTMSGFVGICWKVQANECNNCQHGWCLSREATHSGTVILKKDCIARVQTLPRGEHCCGSMQMSATLLCYTSLVTEQWKRWDLLRQSLTSFKLYTTSIYHACKWAQHVGPKNVACCWPTMLRPFAWALRRQSGKTRTSIRGKNLQYILERGAGQKRHQVLQKPVFFRCYS